MARRISGTERSSGVVKALLLSPVVILFASATRLIIISNYDTTTATTIASSTGVVSTLLGTVVPLLPLFLPALFIVLVMFRRWRYVFLTALATAFIAPAHTASLTDGQREASTRSVNIWRQLNVWPRVDDITSVIRVIRSGFSNFLEYLQNTIWLTDDREREWLNLWDRWPWLLICAGLALLIAFIDPGSRVRPPDSSNTLRLSSDKRSLFKGFLWWIWRWPIGKIGYGIVMVLVTAYAILLVDATYRVPFNGAIASDILRRPWLPAEEVSLTGRIDPLVGYTLSTSDGWHVLLVHQTRQIMYIRSIDVTARAVCHVKPTEPPKQPLIELVGANTYPTDTCFSNAGN